MKISNSKLDLYTTCSMQYKFKYIDHLVPDITSSPLLFGIAIDSALNYILESIRDKKEYSVDTCKELFVKHMETWSHQNRLDFFKNEAPDDLKESIDPNDPDHQEAVWDNIVKRGLDCIDVYVKEIVPQIDEVLSVQNAISIINEEGDEFVGIVDFICKLKDGRTVLMDNKTSSAKYPKNKVIKSQQLSLYLENFPEIEYAGYCVLIKNPAKEKGLTFQLMVDKIPEETKAESFRHLEETLQKIKNNEFSCNFKSCMKYGKPCAYERLCRYNDPTGLISSKRVDKAEKV